MNPTRPAADAIELAHHALPQSNTRIQEGMRRISNATQNVFNDLREELHNPETPRVITEAIDTTLRGAAVAVRVHILSTAFVISGAQTVAAPVIRGARSLANRVRQQ